ncbi:MAG: hypothetical protein PHQ36_03570 [Anaerolineales bacterium]|nr:hypothetical protein [Anaerolineales bacterium]
MLKWVRIILLVVALLFISVGVCLYQFAGLRQYFKSLRIIYFSPTSEIRVSTWKEFIGPDTEWVYGGILAGSWFNRIWVWGGKGLQSFTVDENSVYSWYDGCNEAVLSQLNQGASGKVIGREIITDMNIWRERAKVGDYVRVNLTKPDTGGAIGNLREIYDYNFWLFMPSGMEARCAK